MKSISRPACSTGSAAGLAPVLSDLPYTKPRLMPAPAQDVPSYIPRTPERAIDAKVVAVYAGINFTGPQSVVTLNRGKRDGLEMGHVLALYRSGVSVTNRFEKAGATIFDEDKALTHQLPDERYGLLFVFRVFDKVSYGLVLEATRPVIAGDGIRRP